MITGQKRVVNQLVYLVYGENTDYILEAKFSILSFLRLVDTLSSFRVLVYTDSPEAFDDFPVDIEVLTNADLNDWFGIIGYNHRAKACVLQHALNYAEKTIFVDSDTVFHKSPEELFGLLDDQTFFVDDSEGSWESLSTNQLTKLSIDRRQLIDHINEKPWAQPDTLMLNSGLIGLTEANKNLVDEVLDLIDTLYPVSRSLFTIEQIALSFVLSKNRMHLVFNNRNFVYHYHSRKILMRARIRFFFQQFSDCLFTSQALSAIDRVWGTRFSPPPLIARYYKAKVRLAPKPIRKLILHSLYSAYPYRDIYAQSSKHEWIPHAVERMRNGANDLPYDPASILASSWIARLLDPATRKNLQHVLENSV